VTRKATSGSFWILLVFSLVACEYVVDYGPAPDLICDSVGGNSGVSGWQSAGTSGWTSGGAAGAGTAQAGAAGNRPSGSAGSIGEAGSNSVPQHDGQYAGAAGPLP
jgi:hypothetical protein